MMNSRLSYPLIGSLVAAVVTLGLKACAAWVTGSVGLMSDAAESVVNVLAAGTAYVSLWYSSRPVDVNHHYGHEKIEFFSSGLEGALICGTALSIAVVAFIHLFRPDPLESLDLGAFLAGLATIINFAVALVLFRLGKAHGSIVLEAEGHHLMSDVWTSMAVITGVGLVWFTGARWLDPLCAMLMAGYIFWVGADLVRRSFNGLMDHALPEAEQARVRAAIESGLQAGMTYHALRTRQAGNRRFIDFHLLVPGALSVKQAHDVGTAIEATVRGALAEAEITVHIEPIEEPGAWDDSALVAMEQAARLERQTHGTP
jgi:cation diffusion facilitator family transporter